MSNTQEIIHWSWQEECENFTCMTQQEAIENFYETMEKEPIEGDQLILFGWSRSPVETDPQVLDWFIETLDEEHGNPDKETFITEKMKEAEKVFKEAVLSEYENYWGEVVTKIHFLFHNEMWFESNAFQLEEKK